MHEHNSNSAHSISISKNRLNSNNEQQIDIIEKTAFRNKEDSTSDKNDDKKSTINVADIIGEYGNYQLSLTLLTFIRYVCVAMMTNTGPLIAPTLDFWCLSPPDAGKPSSMNFPPNMISKNRCNLDIKVNGTPTSYKCNEWIFNTTAHGLTLTNAFELNCDRDWLRSAFQSTVSVGVVIASIVFGSFSDEHGRRVTLRLSCLISLIAGSVSIVAPNFITYTIARSICSMSDLGIVGSLYTIIVETLGNKYRGTICLIVFTGWSMGVMVMPWITGHFLNFRHAMLFTVVCHLLTVPWILTVGESIRWLLIGGQFSEAEREIERICHWNMAEQNMKQIKRKFEQMKTRFVGLAERRRIREDQASKENDGKMRKILRSIFGGFLKINQIFKSKELNITTIVWITFNSELLYMLFIMINSDVGSDVKLNYAIGGIMEILATLIAIVMIARMKRKTSLSSTLIIISISIFCLAFTYEHPFWSILVLNFTKLAISTLSSLIYVIATELFPTNLRQTGMGLASTLGSCGAVVAPFIRKELTDLFGMTKVMLTLFLLPLSAALIIPIYLRETKGVELPDDIDEILEEEKCIKIEPKKREKTDEKNAINDQ